MYEYRLDLNVSQILKLLRQVMQYSRECVILGLRVCFRGNNLEQDFSPSALLTLCAVQDLKQPLCSVPSRCQ